MLCCVVIVSLWLLLLLCCDVVGLCWLVVLFGLLWFGVLRVVFVIGVSVVAGIVIVLFGLDLWCCVWCVCLAVYLDMDLVLCLR